LKYNSRTVASKWLKTEWLLEDPRIKPYVPETKLFNRKNLESMMNGHPTVYFKPSRGTGGANIIRIDQPDKGSYRIQSDKGVASYPSIRALYIKLKKFTRGRRYLLQKGIELASSNGNPFDLRVMVQKTNEGEWVSTAVFAKVGKSGKVVNNYHQGGKLAFLKGTLEGAGYTDHEIRKTEEMLKQLGEDVGYRFDEHREGFRELGLDVALDRYGQSWILEVNTRPQFYPLKYFKDKMLYRRIVKYAKEYGRM
jgi:glutathione synthase/RimK-type ligase-like ATP-grasp enzyme